MKLRNTTSSLLFLLLSSSSLYTVTALKTNNALAKDPEPEVEYPKAMPTIYGKPTTKEELGTKDAPVDGQDGKPHKGPFLDTPPTKLKQDVEDLEPQKQVPLSGPNSAMAEDGVMNDVNRPTPQVGKTGTEGGVSEKDRDRKAQEEETGSKPKVPEKPKDTLHTDQQNLKDELKPGKKIPGKTSTEEDKKTSDAKEKPLGAVGIEKPADLPEKPHDIPMPDPPRLPKDDGTEKPPSHPKFTPDDDDDDHGVIQPLHSYVLSLTMILVSEIGDKTFLVAALMAMRHPRMTVFTAAFAALVAMTVLSAILGHAVPTLLPKRFTNFLAAILFLVFGAKMLREGYHMAPDEGVGQEMQEVEAELEEKEHLTRRNSRRQSEMSAYAMESGRGRRSKSNSRLPAPARSPSSSPSRSPSPSRNKLGGMLSGLNNLFSLMLSPAWVQTFIMTFLGEWGDRSQIATIAMAAGKDYWWVTGGAISGHAVCTGVAVVGGRAIAGKVSMRVVTLGGAIAFLIFGIVYLAEAAYSE